MKLATRISSIRRRAWKQWRSWPHDSDAMCADSETSHSLAGCTVSPAASRTAVTGCWASHSISTSGARWRSSWAMARSRRAWPSPPADPVLSLDLRGGEIGTVVWATGYRADHSWLDLPVFDRKGRIRHDGGVIRDTPGAYLLGANLLRRRRSSFIGGAGPDTAEIAEHVHRHLDGRPRSTIHLATRVRSTPPPERSTRRLRLVASAQQLP